MRPAFCGLWRRVHRTVTVRPAATFSTVAGLRAGPRLPRTCASPVFCLRVRAIADDVLQKRLQSFQDLFAEARLCLDDARESEGTTYFKDDIKEAEEAVDNATKAYEDLLSELDEGRKREFEDANSLKVKSLKEEYAQLLAEDH
ncbi:hypothetical protein AK812_SmicGene1426 [Symbiodinium microadriaticum]|uniref:Uncharacterized protein n=1 Tax=Symbiodinium microadriaticum TaxID=2951 RepID=A0A1Q9F476_SYMMI|nr:hypothetical protein AK812_SmicGene1426 [Symbiodinium microadriaticum]